MVFWQETEQGPRLTIKPAWLHFTQHVESLLCESRIKPYLTSSQEWHNLCKPELEKWLGIIEQNVGDPDVPGYLEWRVRFPDQQAVTAFELAWS